MQKDLWALDESAGKAYELGGGLSDTYGRVCRAYRRDAEDALATWEDVFLAARVERLKKLLDDLQTRLNMAGVAVVRAQLDAWSAGVAARLLSCGLPREETVRDGLRALGQFAYYDAAVVHGPDGMRSIRARALKRAAPAA